MTDFHRDQEVRVFTGGGWEKGVYIRTVGESMLIQMPKKVVRVWDPRNVKTLTDKRKNIERLGQ